MPSLNTYGNNWGSARDFTDDTEPGLNQWEDITYVKFSLIS